MSEAVMKLLPLIDALTPEERLELRERMDEGEEDIPRDEWEAAWLEEVERRIADVEAGRSRLVDGEEVMARLRAKYS